MKTSLFIILTLVIVSCTTDHDFDGTYRGTGYEENTYKFNPEWDRSTTTWITRIIGEDSNGEFLSFMNDKYYLDKHGKCKFKLESNTPPLIGQIEVEIKISGKEMTYTHYFEHEDGNWVQVMDGVLDLEE
jgi:hypothetical protein